MYLYKAKHNETGKLLKKEFEEESEAINYADEKAVDYQNYKIIDEEDDEVIASSKLDRQEIDATLDMMFPEGED